MANAKKQESIIERLRPMAQASFLQLLTDCLIVKDAFDHDADFGGLMFDPLLDLNDEIITCAIELDSIVNASFKQPNDTALNDKLQDMKQRFLKYTNPLYSLISLSAIVMECLLNKQEQPVLSDADESDEYEASLDMRLTEAMTVFLSHLPGNADEEETAYAMSQALERLPFRMARGKYIDYMAAALAKMYYFDSKKPAYTLKDFARSADKTYLLIEPWTNTSLDEYFPEDKAEMLRLWDLILRSDSDEALDDFREQLKAHIDVYEKYVNLASAMLEAINSLIILYRWPENLDSITANRPVWKDSYNAFKEYILSADIDYFSESLQSQMADETEHLLDKSDLRITAGDLPHESSPEIDSAVYGLKLFHEALPNTPDFPEPSGGELSYRGIEQLFLERLQRGMSALGVRQQKYAKAHGLKRLPYPYGVETFRDYIIDLFEDSSLEVKAQIIFELQMRMFMPED
jgi:hypothetical protein